MFKKGGIGRQSLEVLKRLGKSDLLADAYLGGGTAAALYFAHRESVDLDFFTGEEFEERVVLEGLKRVGDFKKDRIEKQTILGELEGVKFSYFYYKYLLLDKPADFCGVKVVSKRDLAAMKLQAIADRGSRRDFVDLYFLGKEGGMNLEKMFEFYGKKYGNMEEKKYHLLRSLNYFEDADNEPELKMLVKLDWQAVKEYFKDEVRRLVGEWRIVDGWEVLDRGKGKLE